MEKMELLRKFYNILTSFQLLMFAYILVAYLDIYITMIGIYNFGIDKEANSVIRNVLQTGDASHPFYNIIYFGVVFILLYFFWRFGDILQILFYRSIRKYSTLDIALNPNVQRRIRIFNFSFKVVGNVIKTICWLLIVLYFLAGPASWIKSPLHPNSYLIFRW